MGEYLEDELGGICLHAGAQVLVLAAPVQVSAGFPGRRAKALDDSVVGGLRVDGALLLEVDLVDLAVPGGLEMDVDLLRLVVNLRLVGFDDIGELSLGIRAFPTEAAARALP